jgi:hypothetical protein
MAGSTWSAAKIEHDLGRVDAEHGIRGNFVDGSACQSIANTACRSGIANVEDGSPVDFLPIFSLCPDCKARIACYIALPFPLTCARSQE